MAGTSSTATKVTRLAWSGECCIEGVHERKAELTQALEADQDVELDARELTRVDGAGLQLLAAFVLELGQRGHVLHWHGVSENVANAARVTGLSHLLGLESREAAT